MAQVDGGAGLWVGVVDGGAGSCQAKGDGRWPRFREREEQRHALNQRGTQVCQRIFVQFDSLFFSCLGFWF